MSEDPVSEENLEIVGDYLEEVADRAIDEGKRKRPRATHLFSALQQQHLVGKILKERQAILHRSVVEEEDMLRTCQLGYEGLDEFREDAAEKIDKLDDNITLKKYMDILPPLGNFILGSKTLKENCEDYLQPKQIGRLGRNYNKMKKKVADIDEDTGRYIEEEYTITLQRDYGAAERKTKVKKGDTIWNVEGIPLRDIEHFQILEAINKYKEQTGKNAIWRGAKTVPFEKFLRIWEAGQKK